MTSDPSRSDGSLAVRVAWVPLRPYLPVALPVVLAGVSGLVDGRLLLPALALAGLVLGLVVQLVFSWSRNREGPVMVLGREGLLVRGHPGVGWSDVEKVVISKFRIGRGGALSWLTTLQYGAVVSFVPKPGVHLPPPPGGVSREPGSWEPVRHARYGTNLTVVPSLFDVSARELARAARRWGSLPVEGGDE